MKLLILGGSGFVSGHLARKALELGHEVWAVTRGKKAATEGVHMLHADREDEAALDGALKHAGVTWDAALDCICYNAAHAMIDLKVLSKYTKRLVVISTDSVYETDHKTVPQTEETDYYMQDGGYGCNKRLMEEAFLKADTDLAWTIFRPGHIYGAGSELGCYPEHTRQKDLLRHMLADRPLRLVGKGEFLLHPIDARDLAMAMLSCIDKPACLNQIFCIGGPDILTNARYFEIIGEAIGHPARIENVPLEGYLQAHPNYSGHLCHRAYSLAKLEATGVTMPATRIEEGLREHVRWVLRRDGLEITAN